MRKFLALTCLMALSTAVFAEFDNVSFRLQGINPNLEGIVADEYSDVFNNPADILSVTGYRFYTQFANLSGKGDRIFNDGNITGLGETLPGDNFQFGFIGNPLNNILPNGQLGLFIEQGSAITPKFTGTFAGAGNTEGETTQEIIRSTQGVSAATIKKYGKRQLETTRNDINAIMGLSITDALKLGFRIDKTNTSSEEPINASYTYNDSSATSSTQDYENNTQSTKEEIIDDAIALRAGARIELSDIWNVGATLVLRPIKEERKRSSVVSRYYSNDRNAAVVGSPSTLTATGPDNTEITTALTTGRADLATVIPGIGAVPTVAGIFVTNDTAPTTIIPAGFAWTNGQAFVNDGNMDDDATGKQKTDGTEAGIGFDSYYKLNDGITLFAGLDYSNAPLDMKLNAKKDVNVNVVNWDNTGVSTRAAVAIQNSTVYSGSGKDETNTIGLTFGAEQDLPADVKLAYGLKYTTSKNEIKASYTESKTRVASYDDIGDGLALGTGTAAGDARVTVTEEEKFQSKDETTTNTYDFPIGMELLVTKKLKLRMGVNHRVQETTRKIQAKKISDGLKTTLTEQGATAAVTIVENAILTTGDTLADGIKTVTKARTTQYYYGAGYQWSENLCFDILNFSGDGTGAGILDLAAWRIGATLLFGGDE